MLAISAYEEAVLAAPDRRVTWRASVKDSGGSFRDLTTFGPYNMCLVVEWGDTVDGPGQDATVTLKREIEKWSLAALIAASAFNTGMAYGGSYAKLIDVGREVKIEVRVEPDGGDAAAAWSLVFHGYIDEVDPAAGNDLVLKCSDLQAKLRDTWVERERTYAHAQGANATKGCVIFRPSDVFAVGERVIPTEANRNGHFYRVTAITTGICAATEPVWPTGGGSTVVSGGVTFTESGATSLTAGTLVETVMQQIIDDNLGAGVFTLSTPVSPSWAIKAYKCDRTNVWDQLRMLADQIGWDLRFRNDAGTFKLTFTGPDRAKTTADRSFAPSQRYRLSRMPTQISHIRNVVRVWYSDTADRDAQGIPIRKFVEYTDATSVAAYGRRFMEISEADSSNIDTAAEATALATACVKDLCSPVADLECDVPFFRFVELQDLIQWDADGVHFDSNQKLATVGYRHHLTSGEHPIARTALTTRGKPSSGIDMWLVKGTAGRHEQDLANSDVVTATTTDVVGGTQVRLTKLENKHALPPEYEFHVSLDPAFVPDNTTLKAAGRMETVTLPDLLPGRDYSLRLVAKGRNASRMLRSQASQPQTFTAGQGTAGHLQMGVEWGRQPLNGGFETWNDTGIFPDHWFDSSGYGVGVTRQTGAGGVSGDSWIRFKGLTADMKSDLFTVEGSSGGGDLSVYDLWWWVSITTPGSSGSAAVAVDWYDYAGVFISQEYADEVAFDDPIMSINVGTWYRRGGTVTAPTDARFARIRVLEVNSFVDLELDIDSVRFERS